ncbi:hypothetical protein A2U01_0110679, partial [Trifolium medium]|nr:hypothetical protein [Trifolium medium]
MFIHSRPSNQPRAGGPVEEEQWFPKLIEHQVGEIVATTKASE